VALGPWFQAGDPFWLFTERVIKVTDAEPNDKKNRRGWAKMRREMMNMMGCREEAWGGCGPGQREP